MKEMFTKAFSQMKVFFGKVKEFFKDRYNNPDFKNYFAVPTKSDTLLLDVKKIGRKPVRFYEIDLLRGLCITLVLLYHLAYFFGVILFGNISFGVTSGILKPNYDIYNPALDGIIQASLNCLLYPKMDVCVIFFSGVFIFLTGLSCNLSKNNLYRAIPIVILAAFIYVFTKIGSMIIGQDITILFGILHLLGFCIVYYAICEIFFIFFFKKKEIPLSFNFAMLGIFILIYLFAKYALDIRPTYEYPENGLLSVKGFFEVIFGLKYYGQDDFPVFPNIITFMFGVCFGQIFYKHRTKPYFKFLSNKILIPFNFMGRHSIYFYILEMPIVVIFTVIILLSMGYNLNI